MTKQEVNQFVDLYKIAEAEAKRTLTKLCLDYSELVDFSDKELKDANISISDENITVSFYRWDDEVFLHFPLSFLVPEGFDAYIKERKEARLKALEEAEANRLKVLSNSEEQEYQIYLKLKGKFESEDEVKMSTKEITDEQIDSLVLKDIKDTIFNEYSKNPSEQSAIGLFTLWTTIERLSKEYREIYINRGFEIRG